MKHKIQIIKLTPWFDGLKHLPSRPGWYMTKNKYGDSDRRPSVSFSYYHPNATRWRGQELFWFSDVEWMNPPDYNCGAAANLLWCGLAERPKGRRPVL